MQPIVSTVVVQRPRAEVFGHLDVLANHMAFCDHFMADPEYDGPATGAGGRMRFRVLTPGRSEWVDLEVQESVAPELIVERTRAAGGRRITRGTYRLAEDGPGATQVAFELLLERSPWWERPFAPLARRWLVRQNDTAMTRLKAVLEGATAPAA